MESDKPAGAGVDFPEPEDKDFDEDIGEKERKYYVEIYKDLNVVRSKRLHCTACDRHLGCAAKADGRMRTHPMLRTLVCRACHTFYNSGEFERGDDGSELYCRWCGQGGQVYCCSSCPHVFCAKCIKRNMGPAMIKEIESLDDWKCFKCVPEGLWDLRATCWALLRYCDLKNRQAYLTEDAELKDKYQKECAVDDSQCCKLRKRTSTPSRKKEDKTEVKKETDDKKSLPPTVKIPSGIQVKKFATVNVDSILKAGEKKGIKRPGSPMMRTKPIVIRAPIPIAPYPRSIVPMVQLPMHNNPRVPQPKRAKVQQAAMLLNQLTPEPRKYRAPRPRNATIQYPHISLPPPQNVNFNGFGSFFNSDNINLSLESLTQGLDMASVAAMSAASASASVPTHGGPSEDELVCTPDFPMEPLSEVAEDVADDDVQCITPGPVVPPKPSLLPHRSLRTLPDLSPDNIVQMTENDVTVNAHTGGLKFRVDPQTLSSNKMYRLPDGRIFAINSNPNMPGGYSATIVAVSDSGPGSVPTPAPLRGTTYAANLSAVVSSPPPLTKIPRKSRRSSSIRATTSQQSSKNSDVERSLDMKTPIEWYRYNLIDAVDSLEYSLSRLNRLKKEADTHLLRTRSVEEMRTLHRTLERHLNTSASRFHEVRENLNQGFKKYLRNKGKDLSDDDDVEILPDLPTKTGHGDDPIFIDENSLGSGVDSGDNHDVSDADVTAVSSEHNDSGDLITTGSAGPDPPQTISHGENGSTKNDVDVSNEKNCEEKDSSIENMNDGKNSNKSDVHQVNSDEKDISEKLSNKKDSVKRDLTEKDSDEKGSGKKNSDDKESKESDSNEKDSNYEEATEKGSDKISNDNNSENRPSKEDSLQNGPDLRESAEFDAKENSTKSMEDDVTQSKNDQIITENADEKTSRNLVLKKAINSPMKQRLSDENFEIFEKNETESNDTLSKDKFNVQDKESEHDGEIVDALIPEVNFMDQESAVDENNKINGSKCKDKMDVDLAPSEIVELNKNTDNDLQMSDEMIDNLLADDGTSDGIMADEITAGLQKFSRSLESLADTDIVNSELN